MSKIESAPAQIDFFLVCEEIRIKTMQLLKDFFSDKETRTRSPKDLGFIIVLVCVFFYCFKYSTATKWIAILVYKTTGRASILEVFFVFIIEDFGLDDGGFRFVLEFFDNRL